VRLRVLTWDYDGIIFLHAISLHINHVFISGTDEKEQPTRKLPHRQWLGDRVAGVPPADSSPKAPAPAPATAVEEETKEAAVDNIASVEAPLPLGWKKQESRSVRARAGRLSAPSVSRSESGLHGASVWARRALHSEKLKRRLLFLPGQWAGRCYYSNGVETQWTRPSVPRPSSRSALSVFHSDSVLCGAFVWVHRALKSPQRNGVF
jgi:hypothetical protein